MRCDSDLVAASRGIPVMDDDEWQTTKYENAHHKKEKKKPYPELDPDLVYCGWCGNNTVIHCHWQGFQRYHEKVVAAGSESRAGRDTRVVCNDNFTDVMQCFISANHCLYFQELIVQM
ncbi:hypothetical protein RB195_015417 [Necator americanus]|uniref:Uncharacterized protein n=1 Tax=Necator americanus TaxID=51031 RepID=A0ABR1E748_NECAM